MPSRCCHYMEKDLPAVVQLVTQAFSQLPVKPTCVVFPLSTCLEIASSVVERIPVTPLTCELSRFFCLRDLHFLWQILPKVVCCSRGPLDLDVFAQDGWRFWRREVVKSISWQCHLLGSSLCVTWFPACSVLQLQRSSSRNPPTSRSPVRAISSLICPGSSTGLFTLVVEVPSS